MNTPTPPSPVICLVIALLAYGSAGGQTPDGVPPALETPLPDITFQTAEGSTIPARPLENPPTQQPSTPALTPPPADAVTLSLTLSATNVRLNERIRITLSTNAPAFDVRPSAMPGQDYVIFEMGHQPNSAQFELIPMRPGDITLPPFTAIIRGKAYSTQAQTIRVQDWMPEGVEPGKPSEKEPSAQPQKSPASPQPPQPRTASGGDSPPDVSSAQQPRPQPPTIAQTDSEQKDTPPASAPSTSAPDAASDKKPQSLDSQQPVAKAAPSDASSIAAKEQTQHPPKPAALSSPPPPPALVSKDTSSAPQSDATTSVGPSGSPLPAALSAQTAQKDYHLGPPLKEVAPPSSSATPVSPQHSDEQILPPLSTERDPQEIEEILKTLEERSRKTIKGKKTLRKPNLRKQEHVYEQVDFAQIMRVLSEQAGINYIEPAFTGEEPPVSFRLHNMTPLEVFVRLAESRGYRVLTHNGYTTLTRADIDPPKRYTIRLYPLRHTDPMWITQSVANLLGIELQTPNETLRSFPAPNQESSSGGQTGAGSQTTEASGGLSFSLSSQDTGIPDTPRWTASLPYDAPASTAQADANNPNAPSKFIFVDRRSNGLVVRATDDEHRMIETYLARIDKPEPQIMIETKIVEMTITDAMLKGIDWSRPLEDGLSFRLQFADETNNETVVGKFPPAGRYQPGVNELIDTSVRLMLAPTTLFMRTENLQVVLRNFQRFGLGTVTAQPRVMTRSGVPVTIRSTSVENLPVRTPSTTQSGETVFETRFESFTTGVAIDVVPRLLDNNDVELNINPVIAEETGRTNQSEEYPSGIPIISERMLTTTARVQAGMTVVIGGLNQINSSKASTGIPPANRLPLLGNRLFGNANNVKKEQMLLVFMTPRVIYPNSYERVYLQEAETQQLREANRHMPVYSQDRIPKAVEIRRAQPLDSAPLAQPPATGK